MVFTPYVFRVVSHACYVYVLCACDKKRRRPQFKRTPKINNLFYNKTVIFNFEIVVFYESLYCHSFNKNNESHRKNFFLWILRKLICNVSLRKKCINKKSWGRKLSYFIIYCWLEIAFQKQIYIFRTESCISFTEEACDLSGAVAWTRKPPKYNGTFCQILHIHKVW